MTTTASERRRVPQAAGEAMRGFSFIEILIVMGIIGVLVGMVVVVIQIWAREGPEFMTRNRVQKVAAGVSALKQKFEMFPPADVTKIGRDFGVGETKVKSAGNQTNEGIEALVQALYWPSFGYETGMTDEDFCNTDDDELGKAINTTGNPALLEIRDEWDNPLIYIPASQYGKLEESPAMYTTVNGDDVEVRAWKTEHGGYAQPNSYQLFSMGADEQPNTDDDIRHWTAN